MGALPDAARACLVEAKSLVACPGCTLSSVGMHTAGSVLISSQTARAVLLLVPRRERTCVPAQAAWPTHEAPAVTKMCCQISNQGPPVRAASASRLDGHVRQEQERLSGGVRERSGTPSTPRDVLSADDIEVDAGAESTASGSDGEDGDEEDIGDQDSVDEALGDEDDSDGRPGEATSPEEMAVTRPRVQTVAGARGKDSGSGPGRQRLGVRVRGGVTGQERKEVVMGKAKAQARKKLGKRSDRGAKRRRNGSAEDGGGDDWVPGRGPRGKGRVPQSSWFENRPMELASSTGKEGGGQWKAGGRAPAGSLVAKAVDGGGAGEDRGRVRGAEGGRKAGESVTLGAADTLLSLNLFDFSRLTPSTGVSSGGQGQRAAGGAVHGEKGTPVTPSLEEEGWEPLGGEGAGPGGVERGGGFGGTEEPSTSAWQVSDVRSADASVDTSLHWSDHLTSLFPSLQDD